MLDGRGDQPTVAGTTLQAIPDVKWDAVFDRTSGWTGGDVAGTVDLGHGRVLWLFGDTWIGKVAEGAHIPGSDMVNNSVGLYGGQFGRSGDPPAPSEMSFHWGRTTVRGASDRLDRS